MWPKSGPFFPRRGTRSSVETESVQSPAAGAEGHAAKAGRFFDDLGAALSVLVPLGVTTLRVSAAPQWRDDIAIVQSLGFVPIGGEGAPSALLSQCLALLPLGGRVLRAGMMGAIGAGM